MFLGDMPLLLAEVGWQVTGEKLASGSLLYLEFWDDVAPLSAAVYWIIHEVFGRNILVYHILSFLLVFIQSFIFNNVLNNTKAYNESTYVPALVYALLMSIFFDFNTLSPVLMSMTFILLAINNIFYHIDNKSWVGNLLNTGLFIGIASLFYIPCILFVFPVLLSYILFTGTIPRRYLLFLYGVILPYLLVGVFFFWFDSLDEFIHQFIFANLFTTGIKFLGLTDFLAIATLPAICLLLSFYKLFETNRYTSIQVRFQQTLFFMFIVASISWIIVNKRMPFQLIIFIPVVAFFISHFFLLMQRRIFAELWFLIFLVYIPLVNLGGIYNELVPEYVSYENLLVKETEIDDLIKDKKILVLGDNPEYFRNATLATPYFNWNFARGHFEDPTYYDNLTEIYKNFRNELPEVVVDTKNVFEPVLEAIPELKKKYQKKTDGLYLLKKD